MTATANVTKVQQSVIEGEIMAPAQVPANVSKAIANIDPTNIESIEKFGDDYSSSLATLSNSLATSETKLKNLGKIGDDISGLMSTVKTLDPNIINQKPNFFMKLFGSAKDGVSKFIESQKSVDEVIVTVTAKLREDREELIVENKNLELVYSDNLKVLGEMESLIIQGQQQVEVLKSNLEAYRNSTDVDEDAKMLEVQKRSHFIDRFEQKISRLVNAKALVVRQLPQIRIMQTGNNTEIDTIKDVVDAAIPLWKSQLGLYISQLKTRTALENRQSVTQTINDTIQANAVLMNQNVNAIAEGYSSDIITVETIQSVNTNLIASIDTMAQASERARQQRQESFTQIAKMDDDLKQLVMKK